MNRIVAYENSHININDKNNLKELIDIGYKIKGELGLIHSPIRVLSDEKIYIGNIVGNITLNSINLVIYPKYMAEYDMVDDDKVKKLLNRTIKCANGKLSSTVYFLRNKITNEKNDFINSLSNYYLDIVAKVLKKSRIYSYYESIDKVNTIKGKVLIRKQLTSPIIDEKIWCKFKRLSYNNVYNQLLGWCCRYLSNESSNIDIKRKLLMVSKEFPKDTNLINIHTVKEIKVPYQFKEYEESISIAKDLYLNNNYNNKDNISDVGKICGYVINMERSFENIVCYYSKKVAKSYKFNHKSQAIRQLASDTITDYFSYNVKPDDIISKGDNNLIIDAKYKLISTNYKSKNKPSREDFYQILSTCIAYNSHEAIIIYPNIQNFPKLKWEIDQKINGFKIIIKSESINIEAEEDELIKQFNIIIKTTDFFKEVTNE